MGALSTTLLARLSGFAQKLGARDPTEDLASLLQRSFPLPADDPRYADNALTPGAVPFEQSFCQLAPTQLRIDLQPFAEVDAAERLTQTEQLVRQIAASHFPAAELGAGKSSEKLRFGAFFGAAWDERGLREVKLYRELTDTLPVELRARFDKLAAALPGVRPLMHAEGVAREGRVERLYVRCAEGLRLSDLMRIDDSLAPRIPALAQTVAVLTDGRLFLPPDTAIVGLRALDSGWELKLELLPGALVPEPQALVERALAEDRRAFRRWLTAGGVTQATIGVVSVRVAAHLSPALNVYVRPGADAVATG